MSLPSRLSATTLEPERAERGAKPLMHFCRTHALTHDCPPDRSTCDTYCGHPGGNYPPDAQPDPEALCVVCREMWRAAR